MGTKIKLLAIVGPTATGKSGLAVHIARKFNGEIISADSRQIYTGLDIGTEKITEHKMEGIPHHMIDVVSPRKKFSVMDYKKGAQKIIDDISGKDKLPIVVGGTGFYVDALLRNMNFPEVPPDEKLRKKLEKKSVEELFRMLQKSDSQRARTIESQNKRRLIRALEVFEALGKIPVVKKESSYNVLWLGVTPPPKDEFLKNIRKRVRMRLQRGAISEVQKLHARGIPWKRFEELGLGYRIIADFLRGHISEKDLEDALVVAEWQYAKRQKTWLARNKKIKWVNKREKKNIEKQVKRFLRR